MSSFLLKIVTPAGLRFESQAQSLTVRTTSGDITILPGHINYVAPLGMGAAAVTVGDTKRYGACIGGMVSVVNGTVSLVPTSFEWAENIDVERAKRSEEWARSVMDGGDASDIDLRLAAARLKRALIRQNVASHKPK